VTGSEAPVIPAQAGIQKPTRIALLGAESTGKTRLATGLAAHLRARGLSALAVPEVLRAWCTREGRAPRPDEQLAIAQLQERQLDEAAALADIVIADTSALMVLVYSGMLFPDSELYRFALARQRGYEATLVTGLDLPWVPDGLQRDPAQPREPVDALVRSLLRQAGVGFQVVYGSGGQRLQGALAALVSAGVLPAAAIEREPEAGGRRPWTWSCEKCSDPACEHRLFTQLQESRRSP
jgi:nicotinamide riboside kinase